jgi:hypothetical protein
MANIGGNIVGAVQTKTTGKNAIGEAVAAWADAFSHVGWLGKQDGDSKYTNHSAKVEESTHVFLCDYHSGIYALSLPDPETGQVRDCRMVIKGKKYDVMLIDNPDELDEQLEIYLKYTGGVANG